MPQGLYRDDSRCKRTELTIKNAYMRFFPLVLIIMLLASCQDISQHQPPVADTVSAPAATPVPLDSLQYRIPKPQRMEAAMAMPPVPVGDGFTMTLERRGSTAHVILTANRDVPNRNTRFNLQNKTCVQTFNFYLRIPTNVIPQPSALAYYDNGDYIPVATPEVHITKGNFPGAFVGGKWEQDQIGDGAILLSAVALKGFGYTDDGYYHLAIEGGSNYTFHVYPSGNRYTLATITLPESWPLELEQESVMLRSMSTSPLPYLGMPEVPEQNGRPFPFNQIIVE